MRDLFYNPVIRKTEKGYETDIMTCIGGRSVTAFTIGNKDYKTLMPFVMALMDVSMRRTEKLKTEIIYRIFPDIRRKKIAEMMAELASELLGDDEEFRPDA